MSCVNIFKLPDRAFMMTDATIYQADGTIIGFDRKCAAIDSWNGALSFRGNLLAVNKAIQIAERYPSFDEFVARGGADIERECRAAEEAGEFTAQALFELYLIGWSEREDRPRAFILYSDPAMSGQPDHLAYHWHEISGNWLLGPMPTRAGMYRLHRDGLELDHDYDIADFDPIAHGLPLMEVQRRMKVDAKYFDGEPFHCIGGQAWLTTVDRDGTGHHMIRDWHDEVGEPILPAADKPESELRNVWPSSVPNHEGPRWLKMKRAGWIDPDTLQPRVPVDRDDQPIAAPQSAAPPMNRQQRRNMQRQQAKPARQRARV